MFFGMDKDYVSCCRNYIKFWVLKPEAEGYHFSDEVIDYLIEHGGNGIRELESTVREVILAAKKNHIKNVTIDFVNQIIKK